MHTLIFLFCCTGFFMVYNTSKRAKLSGAGYFERWLQANRRAAMQAGCAIMTVCIAALIWYDGIAIGMFASLLLLMAASAYTIAIAPFFYLKLKHIVPLSALGFALELFIF